MIKPIMRDPIFLAQKSEDATEADKQVVQDLLDTLKALPFLYLVYLLVSYFEHNSHKHINFFKKAKK